MSFYFLGWIFLVELLCHTCIHRILALCGTKCVLLNSPAFLQYIHMPVLGIYMWLTDAFLNLIFL